MSLKKKKSNQKNQKEDEFFEKQEQLLKEKLKKLDSLEENLELEKKKSFLEEKQDQLKEIKRQSSQVQKSSQQKSKFMIEQEDSSDQEDFDQKVQDQKEISRQDSDIQEKPKKVKEDPQKNQKQKEGQKKQNSVPKSVQEKLLISYQQNKDQDQKQKQKKEKSNEYSQDEQFDQSDFSKKSSLEQSQLQDQELIKQEAEERESISEEGEDKDEVSEDDLVVIDSDEEEELIEEKIEEQIEEQFQEQQIQQDQLQSEKKKFINVQQKEKKFQVQQKGLGGDQKKKGRLQVKQKKNKDWKESLQIVGFLIIFIGLMLLLKLGEEKYLKVKRVKVGGTEQNLYEILEIDQGASSPEVKKAYRRLAVLWHPDKNPDCGQVCAEKFNAIGSAYEILGDAEKRQVYDSTSGTIQRIKSRSHQLTEKNFDSLVLEGKEIWIIQVYEDGDGFCEFMGKIWEGVFQKYSKMVKFGRINRETDSAALKYLPIHVTILPTILSFVPGQSQPEIYTFDRKNPELSLQRFVIKSILNRVEEVDENSAEKVWKKMRESDQKDKKAKFFYLSSKNQIPVEIKNAAYKYETEIEFFVSRYGSVPKIQKKLQTGKQENVFISYWEQETNRRQFLALTLQDKKNFPVNEFVQILQLLKLTAVPAIDRSSFKDYCEKQNSWYYLNEEETVNEESEKNNYLAQVLCVLIPSSKFDDKMQKQVYKIQNEIVLNCVSSLQKKNLTWENQNQEIFGVQFVTFDDTFHNKINQYLQNIEKGYIAAAILAENHKISAIHSIIALEDWVFDSLDGKTKFTYLEQEKHSLEPSQLFQFQWETLPYLIKKTTTFYFFNWKSITALTIFFVSINKILKKKFLFSLQYAFAIYSLQNIVLTVLELNGISFNTFF